jgi:serine/threonine-protein kinase
VFDSIASARRSSKALKSRRACGWGLLAAAGLAFVGFAFPATIDSQAAVAWSAVWIAGFPLLSRSGPRETLLWAVLAASVTPLALLVASVGTGIAFPGIGSLLLHIAPVYVAAFVAAFLAKYLDQLEQSIRGAQRLGVYELEGQIGQGGMGEVWRAKHALLSRPAAIKLIKPKRLPNGDEVVDERAQQRFACEAQITASLQSPHTVQLYDFGVTQTGTFYYVMELLEGSNLEQLVEREGPIAPDRVVHVLRQVLDSLAEAHERGLVHRDIKPANIVVSKRGLHEDFVKVLDFGLVQSSERAPSAKNATVQGTPAYIAPESVTGLAPIDARTDLYAVGCVAYWMLTGTTPFDGKTATQMAIAHAVETPETPSERLGSPIGWALESVVMDCLAKDPAKRPQSALALLDRLRHLDEQQEFPALPYGAVRPAAASAIN